MRGTRAVVSRENLIHNLSVVRSFIKGGRTKLCLAVKADGYGCGAVFAAKTAIECGASSVAVATVDEGIELREGGVSCPVLLLSLCSKEEMEAAVKHRLSPLVFDAEYIDAFDRAASRFASGKLDVHLAIDTGMGRIGCAPNEAAAVAKKIAGSQSLALAGTCTHFSSADEPNEEGAAYTEKQFADFMAALRAIEGAGVSPGIRHCSASAATLSHPEMQLDMVRCGIAAYGYFDGGIDEDYFAKKGMVCALKPVLTLETEVATIRPFKAGSFVSYGRTWRAKADTDIATLSIGYADGLLRRLSPGLKVAINGKNYPVVGTICMDQCMVDIGKNNQSVRRWDKAVVFGAEESGALQDASDVAKLGGTIAYEILTGISKRVPRIVE